MNAQFGLCIVDQPETRSDAPEPVEADELNAWKRGFTPQAEIWNGRLAMIGAAAVLRLGQNTGFTSLRAGVAARWPLDESNALYAPDPPF